MAFDTVGSIEYDARINTSRLKGDAAETEAIVAGTGKQVEKTGERSFSAFGQWAKIGILAAGVATAALGASTIKTGIEYNTLQQTSRAALTTILGGVEAANTQMDKLNEFVRTSPFAKDIFIKAQQQLLGFGVEAQKVIPALDAIQNAVAAVGGSSADIGAVTDVLAKLKSEGRISGEALLQLGGYGIDAATIIGEQMGKTGAEIREMASRPGGIPVDQIWDPLVTGLDKKFGGAADNVKNTWAGTADRIKAAFRDLGSVLAAPFINPQGGGAGIAWGNKLADALRSIQKGLPPLLEKIEGFVDKVVEFLKPVTDFIVNNKQAWENLKLALMVVAVVIGTVLVVAVSALLGVFAVLQVVINLVAGLIRLIIWEYKQLYSVIYTVITAIIDFGAAIYRVFSGAVNNIRNFFGGIPEFIRGIWNSVINIFGNIGSTIGNAIGNSFKVAVNGILWFIERTVNNMIDTINGAIHAIDNITPGGLPRVSRISIPRLAEGGVVQARPGGILANIGEGGQDEAVIPLDKLDSLVSNDQQRSSNVTVNVNMTGIMARSKADERDIAKSLIRRINEELSAKNQPLIGLGAI
jgi:tape measure domain-containing protein